MKKGFPIASLVSVSLSVVCLAPWLVVALAVGSGAVASWFAAWFAQRFATATAGALLRWSILATRWALWIRDARARTIDGGPRATAWVCSQALGWGPVVGWVAVLWGLALL